jgi:GAF domain-containing protein
MDMSHFRAAASIVQGAGPATPAIERAVLWQAAQVELARRTAITRISRAFAESAPGSSGALEVLLHEAQALLGADHGGVCRWDTPSQTLVQVYSSHGPSSGITLDLEHSLSGRAALDRRPVVANDYQGEYGQGTPAGRAGARSSIAAPLVHEGRLIGAISVGCLVPGRCFGPDDGETLELLAGMAALMLVTLERAQVQAVSLASRELDHRLNNDLALAVGTIDLLRGHPALGRDLLLLVEDAAAGLQRVGEQLRRLQQVTRFQIRETPVGPALDLDRSADTAAPPA